MKDDLGIFDSSGDTGDLDLSELREALARSSTEESDTADAGAAEPRVSRTTDRRRVRAGAALRHRRKIRSTIVAVLVLALIAAGVVTGLALWRKQTAAVTNWQGNGTTEVVIRVLSGDSLSDIGTTLAQAGVVADAASFVTSATNDADLSRLPHGYYKVRLHSSDTAAADALTNLANHVGMLRLTPGGQLADIATKSGATAGADSVRQGYIATIAAAACVEVNGQKQNCFTADDLWKVEETAGLATLGVVDWAADGVENSPDPKRRLEGMILPGDYDIAPGSTPEQALSAVVNASAALWNQQNIIAAAKTMNVTPYQVAIIASLVEREGITKDMPKVARVVYNRLAQNMPLQFDSTVNYALDRAQIATSNNDRDNPSPYNTYQHTGLPPTPISSPGDAAIAAAMQPPAGPWLYFVKVDLDGNSCFSTTLAEHNACVAKARANGVFG